MRKDHKTENYRKENYKKEKCLLGMSIWIKKIFKKGKQAFLNVRNHLISGTALADNRGMGVVEVILIILVLVGLVLVFKTNITTIVNSIFKKITTKVNSF